MLVLTRHSRNLLLNRHLCVSRASAVDGEEDEVEMMLMADGGKDEVEAILIVDVEEDEVEAMLMVDVEEDEVRAIRMADVGKDEVVVVVEAVMQILGVPEDGVGEDKVAVTMTTIRILVNSGGVQQLLRSVKRIDRKWE
jgi:hypothetical protein